MFDSQITIKGKHGEYMKELSVVTADDKKKGIAVFSNYTQIYLLSAIIGVLYDKKVQVVDNEPIESINYVEQQDDENLEINEEDNTISKITKTTYGKETHAQISQGQILKEKTNLEFVYNLVMLYHNQKTMSNEQNTKRVFLESDKNNEEQDWKIFESYVLGGIEFIYEKLTDNGLNNNIEQVSKSMMEMVVDFCEKFEIDCIEDAFSNNSFVQTELPTSDNPTDWI
ncbi:MAG: hypothetical protein FWF56_05235 [Firmicutes bacterium]|nr:hypothetical protein [Bacillota bacterium]MCL1953648.1 hypothetical protein [Bacillota bacterium]